jgi:ATP-dependent protease Clp ATPase subunit
MRLGKHGTRQTEEPLRCSFCSKAHHEVERLFSGGRPDVNICNECLEICEEILADYQENPQNRSLPVKTGSEEQTPASCSFCLKTAKEATRVIAGPAVYICDQCIARLRA